MSTQLCSSMSDPNALNLNRWNNKVKKGQPEYFTFYSNWIENTNDPCYYK